MEQQLLQFMGVFIGGLVCGILLMLVINKLSSGRASASGVKQEFDDYQEKVESHFEETSKKFQDMTAQYQDLYKHLSVGATTLCRSDSAAASLADQSADTVKIEKQDQPLEPQEKTTETLASTPIATHKPVETAKEVDAHLATKPVTSDVDVAVNKNEISKKTVANAKVDEVAKGSEPASKK